MKIVPMTVLDRASNLMEIIRTNPVQKVVPYKDNAIIKNTNRNSGRLVKLIKNIFRK